MTAQDAPYQTKEGHILNEDAPPESRWLNLRDWVLQRVWYVHPITQVTVQIPPSRCYQVLETVSRPSAQRLHHGKLFANGRRYHLRPRPQRNFQMTTSNSQFWNRRRRTSPMAVLFGKFATLDTDLTELTLQSRIRINIIQIARAFFWPVFLTSIIVLMPWPLLAQVALCVALFSAAWFAFRLTAILEAHEMIFFVGKALEEFAPDAPDQLPTRSADLIYEHGRDFSEMWEKFYERMREDTQ